MQFKGAQMTVARGHKLPRRFKANLPVNSTERAVYIRFHDQCPALDPLGEGRVGGDALV